MEAGEMSFIPKIGEEILVWDDPEEDPCKRIFITMAKGFYVCEQLGGSSLPPLAWRYAMPIEEENPWHDITYDAWPDCVPEALLEVVDEQKCQRRCYANKVDWCNKFWVQWRLAK